MLPVEAQMTALAPSSTALLMATVMPRSLKLPVGLRPSTLRKTSQPTSAETFGAGTSGVPPSRRVTTGVVALTGSRSRYSSMSPRQTLDMRFLHVTCGIGHRVYGQTFEIRDPASACWDADRYTPFVRAIYAPRKMPGWLTIVDHRSATGDRVKEKAS